MPQRRNKLNLKYIPDMDIFYIYLEPSKAKILTRSSFSEDVAIFVSKEKKNTICGYEIVNARESFEKNIQFLQLEIKQLVGVALCFSRSVRQLSQEKMADFLGIGLTTYKQIENGELNFSIEIFQIIGKKFPEIKRIIGKYLRAT